MTAAAFSGVCRSFVSACADHTVGMFRSLLDLLFPPASLTGELGAWVTAGEWKQLHGTGVVIEGIDLKARGIMHLDRVIGARDYRHPLLRRAIHTFKYRRVPALQEVLGSILAEPAARFWWPEWVIVPVPLHWARYYWRGFNQAELLAEHLSQSAGAPVRLLLKRNRPTGHQMGRGRAERLTAVRDAFSAVDMVPRKIVLVDDVCTTGATLDACAAALKLAGAQEVVAMVVAVER